MEKGSLRCDANISLKKKKDLKLGTKVELKNMNSFKAVKDALSYEVERQKEFLKKNKTLIQETRLWDPKEEKTISMRTKEEAQDYRYFPEPDLVPFVLEQAYIEKIKDSLPEMPASKKQRFIKSYGLSFKQAKFIVSEKKIADYFESCVNFYNQPKVIYNWLSGPLVSEMNERKQNIEDLNILVEDFCGLIKMVEDKKISNLKAKEILKKMLDNKKSFSEIIQEEQIVQISDTTTLNRIIEEVIKENPKSVQDYKSGKTNAIMFLVGQVMKKTQKNAQPQIVQKLLKEVLDKG